jgi:hypothetical protein
MSTPVPYRPFADYSLQRAIDRAVMALPEGKTMALVAHVDDTEGASLSMLVKLDAGGAWTLKATVVKGWNEPFKYGAEVIWSR